MPRFDEAACLPLVERGSLAGEMPDYRAKGVGSITVEAFSFLAILSSVGLDLDLGEAFLGAGLGLILG